MELTSQSILTVLYTWIQGMLAPVLALSVSAVYFFTSPKTESLSKRLLASAHGLSIAALYLAAMTIFWTNTAHPKFQIPFLFSLVIPALLIGISFFIYRGNKTVHFLQLLNLLCLSWTFFIGSMAVTGKWL